jgi:hypothetical protein
MPEELVNITIGKPEDAEKSVSGYNWQQDKIEKDEMVDFNIAYWRRTIAMRIKQEFDNYLLRNEADGFRSHLGWSVIGHQCLRYIWYHFRWFKQEQHSARMLEIFNTGHAEEARIRALMVACGAKFLDNVDVDGQQITISDLMGHFGGSTDGVFIWPAMGIFEPTMLECKTSKDGSEFNNLEPKSMAVVKERHYIQVCGYASSLGIKNILYACRNKNTSELYLEILQTDETVAAENRNKAWHIITTKSVPSKISKKRNFWVCNMCQMQAICHDRAQVVPNCRNCKHSTPVEDGQWNCEHHNAIIPKEFLIKGCNAHQPLEY